MMNTSNPNKILVNRVYYNNCVSSDFQFESVTKYN
jgi:hypothetical protein